MGLLEELGIDCATNRPLNDVKGDLSNARKKMVLRQNAANMKKRIHAEMLLVQVGEMSSILDSVEDEIVDAALLLYTYAYAYDRDAINNDLIDSLIGAAKKDFKSTEKIMNSYKRSDTDNLFDRWSLYYKCIGGAIAPSVDRKHIDGSPDNKIQVTKPITKVVKKNILYADAANERAKVLLQKYLEGNMYAHKLKITPANCHQRVFSAGGQRFFFVVTCEGIVLNENQTATFTEENPLEVEILAEVGNCDKLRRIDLFFGDDRVYSYADYNGITHDKIQEIKFYANAHIRGRAVKAVDASDYSKALYLYNQVKMDYSDDWRAKFWIPCLNALIGNDDALSECQKILIPTYDVFASWSNQNSVIKEATKISKYAVLAAESVWNRAKENHGLTTKDYAQVSYMCALITTIVGNQLESRFIKEIPLMKTSMLYAWSRGLLIFEDAIKNSEDPDRVQRIKLYNSTKSKYEYYLRDLPNKYVIRKNK